MMPVICIVGKNKSAKTKLMEALIKELKARELKVGALKYHKHGDFEIDIEGKDTWKYAKAGADAIAIYSSVKFALIKNVETGMNIEEICDGYFRGCDIVLADGFTLSDKPRIIIADGDENIEIFKRGCEVVAVAGGNGSDDIAGITERVLKAIKEHKNE